MKHLVYVMIWNCMTSEDVNRTCEINGYMNAKNYTNEIHHSQLKLPACDVFKDSEAFFVFLTDDQVATRRIAPAKRVWYLKSKPIATLCGNKPGVSLFHLPICRA